MTRALEIATPFADFSELSENFAQRVDNERLMLPYAEPVAEGEWVTFTVLFADGSTALAGTGKCSGSYDNGEEHPPEYRFDVVVESLSLEGTAEVMFERLLMARNSIAGDGNAEPGTGEVSLDELEGQAAAQAAEVEAAPEAEAEALDAVEADVAPDAGGFDEPLPTAVADLDELAAQSVPSDRPPPPRPAGRPATPAGAGAAGASARARPGAAQAPAALPSPHTFEGSVLTRPSQPAAWTPEPAERPAPATSSGLFDYGRGGLPRPPHPPRPEIADDSRVQRAPGPGRPARRLAPSGSASAGVDEAGVDETGVDETGQYDVSAEEESA